MRVLRLAVIAAVLGGTAALATPGASHEQILRQLRALETGKSIPSEQELDTLRDSLYEQIQSLASDPSSYGGVPARLLAARYSLRAASVFLHRFGRAGDAYDFGADAASIYEELGTPEGDLAAGEVMAKLDEQLESVAEGVRLYDEQFQGSAGTGTGTKKSGGKGKGTVGKKKK